MFDYLLKSGKIGKLEVKNRMVVPAMGTGHCEADDTVGDGLIAFFAARAKGGFGLLITDNTYVDPPGKADMEQIAIYSDDFIPGFQKLTECVHAEGAKIFMQLAHGGRETSAAMSGEQPVAPSPIPCPVMREVPRELSTEEVYRVIEKFGDGALRAKKAGFDGVELHGAHGYLIAEFMSAYTNKRTDEFGGDILGRANFAIKIIQNIKKKCGVDFPVCMRMSGDEIVPDGRHIEETKVLARLLEANGADALHISVGVYAVMPYMIAPSNQPGGFLSKYAGMVKSVVSIPVITVGRISDPALADSIIASNTADFVALGRTSIADPEFPNKVMENRTDEIIPCVACLSRCGGSPGITPGDVAISCMLNPFSGHELTMNMNKTDEPKNVLIVGAGVGGLEAAWILAARGHKVTVLEKSDKAGGQVITASMPPHKSELARAVKYFKTMCKKFCVEIHYNTEATSDSIIAMNPDIVILATGATPICPNIPNEGIQITQAVDILTGKAAMGENNLIVGGGLVGLETAEFILSQKRRATVVEMLDSAGADMNDSLKFYIFQELREGNIEIKTGTKVACFTKDGAVCLSADGRIRLEGYDNAILAIGSNSYNPLEKELNEKIDRLYVIGDAAKPRRILDAIEEAARLAITL